MATTINHNLPKKQAILLVKKAVSSKVAVIKDKGDVLIVGAPMMTAEIKITDTTIEVSGKGAGKMVESTCASAIQMEIDIAEQSAPAQPVAAPAQSAAEQPKAITAEEKKEYISALRELKGLLDDEIITKEEFEIQKADILEKMNGGSKLVAKPEPQKEEIIPTPAQTNVEPVPVVEAIKSVEPKTQKEPEITKEVEKVTEPVINDDINARYHKREVLSFFALIIGLLAFGVAIVSMYLADDEYSTYHQTILSISCLAGLFVVHPLSITSCKFAKSKVDKKILLIITLLISSISFVLSIISFLIAIIA